MCQWWIERVYALLVEEKAEPVNSALLQVRDEAAEEAELTGLLPVLGHIIGKEEVDLDGTRHNKSETILVLGTVEVRNC